VHKEKRMLTDVIAQADHLEEFRIPGVEEALSLRLPTEIAALRDRALALHQERGAVPAPVPELILSDARAWAVHTEDEDWLIWRARRCAERLKSMPLEIEPGERIVGRPHQRDPSDTAREQLEQAQTVLASMPAFPGGDAGHFHPDFGKLFRVGVSGILAEIASRRQERGLEAAKVVFYDACLIALESMAAYIRRVSDACEAMGERAGEDAVRWRDLASACRRLTADPPCTFHEAVQLMFMTQVALWFGEDHALTPPGRIDQTLESFYEADLALGRITRRQAFELICCLYIQANRILQTGSALSVMVGGRDGQGNDVTNELTYLSLAARLATRLSYPTVGLAWHEGTPPELTNAFVAALSRGTGDPAFFNDELIVLGLRDHGVRPVDAYNHMNSTCVEVKVVGQSNVWVTQPYFNLPLALLEVMEDIARGRTSHPQTYEDLSGRVRENLALNIAQEARRLDQVWRDRAQRGCFPLASCFTLDCLERGLDLDRGGARYNWVENSFVGLANLVDSLVAVRHLVYEQGDLSLSEFHGILQKDFRGHEILRRRILNTLPKYGNDQDEPDQVAREWAGFLMEITESHVIGPHRYVPGFFCWIMHERLGSQTGATPDGRRALWPLADGAGAAQGREMHGPSASVLSTTKWSHRKALGGLVHNVKLSRGLLRGKTGRDALRGLIESYLRRGGFEIQVNAVDRDILLEAREHPERHADLLVRVAGYSDYFVKLPIRMQAEIIARTEHVI